MVVAQRTEGGGEEKRAAGKEVVADPAILAVIKDPARPAGFPVRVPTPETVPGKVGRIEGVRTVLRTMKHGVGAVEEMRAQHGDVFRTSFMDRDIVFVVDADEVQKIARNDGNVWSAALGWDMLAFEGLEQHGGNMGTLVALDFDDHKAARALVQPAFTMKAIQGYIGIAQRAYDATIPRWLDQGAVGFKREARTLLASVAGEIFTGITDPKQVRVIDRALSDFWNGMMAISRNPWLSTRFRRSRSGFARLRDTFLALAPERRKTGGNDLFSHMCHSPENANATDESLVRVFLTIMFGAFDTTSAGVASMGYLLARHPEWQERLRDEARQLPAGPLDAAALRSLKQMEWVWKETLRLMPVAGFVPRRALREVEIKGHVLRAGTNVGAFVGGIGRHPKWWKEPTRFDPERFSPERAEDKQHPALQMPFGAGAHACIGTQLAGIESKLLFHKLLTSTRWQLKKPYEARHTFAPLGCVSGDVTLAFEKLPALALVAGS